MSADKNKRVENTLEVKIKTHAKQNLLSPAIHSAVKRHFRAGARDCFARRYNEALLRFQQAWTLLPPPAIQWDASLCLLLAFGEAYYECGHLAKARKCFERYLRREEFPTVRLMLAFACFKLGERRRAKKEMRAACANYSLADLDDPGFWPLVDGFCIFSKGVRIPRTQGQGLHHMKRLIIDVRGGPKQTWNIST